MKNTVFTLLLVLLTLSACGGTAPEASITEVTRIVEIEVEVTRLVDVVVTEVVEVVKEVVVTATPLPTPKASPTPRATATPEAPEVGTVTKPVPVGESVDLVSTSEDGEQQEVTITVLEVIRGDEALQRIMAANQFNDRPPEGYDFVMALIEATAPESNSGLVEISKYSAATVIDGRILEYFDMDYLPCCLDPDFDIQLLPGGTGQGWLALPAAVDELNPLMLIGSPEGGVYFSLATPEPTS